MGKARCTPQGFHLDNPQVARADLATVEMAGMAESAVMEVTEVTATAEPALVVQVAQVGQAGSGLHTTP